MTTPVGYYGFHTDDSSGVTYLHQGRAANNFIGMRDPSPFHVAVKKSRPCPHFINAAASIPDAVHWQQFSRHLEDPLVQAMLPIPKGRSELIPFLSDPNNQMAMILVILSRMSGPIYPVVQPLRSKSKIAVLEDLSITNACPLVLTNVQCDDNDYMFELAREARTLPRRLLFTGDPLVVVRAPLQRITTGFWDVDDLSLAALPMESLGALLVRRFGRNERLDAEITKGAKNE
jgi:hypothetical protein